MVQLRTSRVAAVASALGMHPRMLNRRLARQGTSVFELMKEVRFQIARDLLANTSLPITEIAATLLYANNGAFTRGREPQGLAARARRHASRCARIDPVY